MEIWKDIKGYDGYQISNIGRVWSVHRQKYLYQTKINSGYMSVHMKANNGKIKRELVHRLVALAFIPNPECKPQVNHIDHNRQNNKLENLEWITAEENQRKRVDTRTIAKYSKDGECLGIYQSIVSALESIGEKTKDEYHKFYMAIQGNKPYKDYYFKELTT